MRKNKLPSERVMLLLPGDLATFVDLLAQKISPPGVSLNRQEAIRISLGKLKTEMEKETPPPTPAPRKKTARK